MCKAAWLVPVLAGGMAMAGGGLRVDCIAEGKAAVPEGLCDAFSAQLAAASPGEGAARLVILAAGGPRFSARIDWLKGEDWMPGPAFGLAQADKAPDAGKIEAFLAELIAATPRP